MGMKISEIRNRLFGLSDLKGLINENTLEEYNWQDYFIANPERINQSFLQALGLKSAPKTPITIDQIGDSEFRKHFGDEEITKILSDPTNFKKNNGSYIGIGNSYENAVKNRRRLLKQTGLELFFKERFHNEIFDNDSIVQIYRIAREARRVDEWEKMKIIFSEKSFDLNNPYSIFLFFFFDLQPRTGNSEFINKTIVACLNRVAEYDAENNTDFSDVFQKLTGNYLKEKSLNSGGYNRIIEENLLNNLNLMFLSPLNDGVVSLIYNTYFTNPSLPEIRNTIAAISQNNLSDTAFDYKTLKEYNGTVGGLLLAAMSVIFTCLGGDFNSGIEIAVEILSDQKFSGIRSSAFEYIYQTKFNLSATFLNDIVTLFGVERNKLFDFTNDQIERNEYMYVVNVGLEKWYQKYNIQGFNELSRVKQTGFVFNNDDKELNKNVLFIEVIASAAEILLNFVGQKFKKYEISKRIEITFSDLLGNASDGLEKMAMYKEDTPIPQKRLSDISQSFGRRDVKLWEVINVDNDIKDKTQYDIFVFLRQNSDGDVTWSYEYNRPGKRDSVDEGLGDKSIDIMGTKGGTRICFEYQGEEHFRPLNVRQSDYENQFLNGVRDEILKLCGYVVVGKNGTRFVKREGIGKLSTQQKKQIILQVFSGKLSELAAMQQAVQRGGTSNDNILFKEPNKDVDTKKRTRLNEVFHFEKLNRRDLTIAEAEDYFSTIVSRGIVEEGNFKNPEIGGIIPYIGSPYRFLEEIKTAEDMTNDQMKSEVIKSRGWIMSYIIPRGCTQNEIDYTKNMSTNGSVFTWDKKGKEDLLAFLTNNNFRTNMVSENRTSLFQSIVNDVLREHSS